MKKALLTLILPCALLSAAAQEYLSIGTYWHGSSTIPIELIDSITFCDIETMLPDLMDQDDNIKLFNEALRLTGMRDSLVGVYDKDFYYDGSVANNFHGSSLAPTLQRLRKGYTAFVESDMLYAKYGIYTIEDLKAYAAKVYDEVYPEDAGVTDPTDRRNSLNRFVSYHLLDRMGTTDNLTAAGIYNEFAGEVKRKYIASADYWMKIADWHETMMPHSLLKCAYYCGELYLNSRCKGHQDILIKGPKIYYRREVLLLDSSFKDYIGIAHNGYYHYISDILTYGKETQESVFDEEILVNNSTISPEFMNNGLRCNSFSTNSDHSVFLPKGSLKNVQINNDDTRMYYLLNHNWSNVQTDEFIILGLFDITFKLPPVPAGTYELNIGYSASTYRPVAACYLDEKLCDTIDFRHLPKSPNIGWISDQDLDYSYEAIEENDRLLFNNGYRKGLNYCYDDTNTGLMRDNQICLRRIITTFTTDGKSDHYIRFKNVLPEDNGTRQFMIDFFELCPTHLLKEYETIKQ